MINIQTNSNKDILAKLMAKENINVIHKPIPTAYFDVKSRTLACPILKDDMSPELYDLFMGHEVGHALNTPAEGWHDAVSDLGMTFKGYLNVIEDIRIEKKIKNTYPGLRKSFYSGYSELGKMDFFGLTERNQDVSELGFIDRINLHYKLGAQCRVEFSDEEMVYIKRCDSLETFEEVMNLAKELFENKKEETETMLDSLTPEELKAMLEDMDLDDSEDSGTGESIEIEGDGGEASETSESEEESDSTGDEGKTSDGDGEISDSKEGGQSDQEKIADQLNKSETDESFRSKEGSLNKETEDWDNPHFFDLPTKIKYKNFIVGYKELNKEFESEAADNTYIKKYVKNFIDNNKKIVNYMVKEFEMKKAAAAYNRSYGAKSGELDMDKLSMYKLKDDIFNRVQVTPEGKNHGVVMAVDWSGSMSGSVKATVEQALLLAMFCRRIQIPFRVFAFSDAYSRGPSRGNFSHIKDHDERHEAIQDHRSEQMFGKSIKTTAEFNNWNLGDFKLLEIVTDKMSNKEFTEAMENWIQLSFRIDDCYNGGWDDHKSTWKYDHFAQLPINLYLGGTPLDHTLIVMRDYLTDFKAQLGIDIMSFIALTDGQSHGVFGSGNASLVDRVTNKTIKSDRNWTSALLKWVKETADVRTIGFYLTKSSGNNFLYDAANFTGTKLDTWSEEFNKKRLEYNKISTSFDGGNYDLSIIINQRKIDINYDEDVLSVSENATKGQLKNALVKAGNNKMKQRVILHQFVQQMAV
jgi:hypothetical protein